MAILPSGTHKPGNVQGDVLARNKMRFGRVPIPSSGASQMHLLHCVKVTVRMKFLRHICIVEDPKKNKKKHPRENPRLFPAPSRELTHNLNHAFGDLSGLGLSQCSRHFGRGAIFTSQNRNVPPHSLAAVVMNGGGGGGGAAAAGIL